MPASLKRIKSTGGSAFLHRCEACGEDASFGYGVSLRLAVNSLMAGNPVIAKRHLGEWYCGVHRPEQGRGGES